MRRITAVAATAFAALLLSTGTASAANCPGGALPGSEPQPRASGQPIEFGIFPGAQAGAVAGPQQQAKPEDPAKTRAALADLRSGRPLAVHLYLSFTNGPDMPATIQAASDLVDRYRAQGLDVEYVLAYRPQDRAGAPDVAAFAAFARAMVDQLGPRLHALQITNEVNNSASPDASDGAYPGAEDALIEGVIAAKDEARRRGLDDLAIGFNWMYRQAPQTDQQFWEYLRDHGGARFVDSLDWVGADVYPGTFFPPAVTSYRDPVVNALDALRTCYMTIPAIPKTVPIHITESGYPTGPGRSYDEQERALREMVGAYSDFSGNYNVSDYRWFLLRDGNSDVPDFQQQYGLLRDDYTPKPAFAAYKELIARLGGPPAPPQALHLSVRPKVARVGRRMRFVFAASIPGAAIHFAHRRVVAGAHGHASIVARLRAPGVRPARASLPGFLKAIATVRVRRR